MRKINLNLVAKEVTAMEVGDEEVNIAQTKEIMRCFLRILNRHLNNGNASGVMEVIERIGDK